MAGLECGRNGGGHDATKTAAWNDEDLGSRDVKCVSEIGGVLCLVHVGYGAAVITGLIGVLG